MLLRPGENIWRKERAQRAAVLIDAGRYFGAVRSALRKAQERVFIVGWDIHSRTRLVGESGRADDGYPEALGDFLSAIARERPQLKISVLLWDFAVLYTTEREFFPEYALQWATPPGVNFCLDNAVPIGSSQHQKLIVVDDCVAFSGGLDVTIRRWDTGAHRVDEPGRRDPYGRSYEPFHDVQALVQGEAAQAISDLARARWRCASGEIVPKLRTERDCWPDEVQTDFSDVEIGIARTQPAYEEQREIREVEALFLESIATAERTIYLENQFLSSMKVARALAERLRARPQLELLMVAPATHHSWLEARSMRNGRIRFMRMLSGEDIAPRVRLVHPQVSDGGRSAAVMVHSKVMAIDDKVLRIGSANLNNRSMGTDTECDLVIEAVNAADRAAITQARNRLIGDHCGATGEEVAAALRRSGSLLALADTFSNGGHRLRTIEDGEPDRNEISAYIEDVADPEQPIGAEEYLNSIFGVTMPRRSLPAIAKAVAIGLAIIAAALIWEYTPLAAMIDPKSVGRTLREFADGPSAPFVVALIFVGGGLIMFPVTVLIAATAATFGPWLGFIYAGSGTLLSALVTYGIGAWLGKKTLRDVVGPRLDSVRRRIARKGVVAVAVIRLIPLAPFTVVNLLAGASDISLAHYILGTIIGMLPGIFVMSVLGHQLSQIVLHPEPQAVALLAVAILGWIGLSIGVQALVSKFWDVRP